LSSVIAGAGHALPRQSVPNSHFDDLGLTDRWITSRTGIRQRRRLAEGESLTGLAVEASGAALADAGIDVGEVDFIVAATLTADRLSPALSTELGEQIGARGPGAVDVNGACAGFLFAYDYAVAKIESGRADCVLVCGAEATSRITDPRDPASAPLFGDSAGAVVVRRTGCGHRSRPAIHLETDGRHRGILFVERDNGVLRMTGTEVYELAITSMTAAIRRVCEQSDVDPDDVDLFVPHQANARIIRQIGAELKISPERVAVYIGDLGNTSAASIPTALSLARRDGRLRPGDILVMSAFGAGLSWGAALTHWQVCRECAAG
jgi:3-oxoacyl-[acyl-carrier-protein] synthase III